MGRQAQEQRRLRQLQRQAPGAQRRNQRYGTEQQQGDCAMCVCVLATDIETTNVTTCVCHVGWVILCNTPTMHDLGCSIVTRNPDRSMMQGNVVEQ